MLIPKKVKHRKWHKGRTKGLATQRNELSFGHFGLKALGSSWVSSRQIEASRRAITRYVKKGGKIWIRIFPDKPITQKSSEVGMGGGKGPVDHYVVVVKPGMILFEIDGISKDLAKRAMTLAGYKLPIKTKFVVKS